MLNRHFFVLFFLTFVWLPLSAAPKVTTQLPNTTMNDQSALKTHQGKAEIIPTKTDRTWAAFVQYYNGTVLEKDESYHQFHYGVQASFDPFDLRASVSERTAAFSASMPKPLLSNIQLSDSMEPFYRYGLDWILKTSDGLESFANTKRLQVFAAVGLKDIGYLDRRISAEVGVGLSLTGFSSHVLIGCHF